LRWADERAIAAVLDTVGQISRVSSTGAAADAAWELRLSNRNARNAVAAFSPALDDEVGLRWVNA